MRIGTKSILFGAHCFFIHPFIIALAWWKLYGFPFDLRLWIAFFVHDLGYCHKPNMDGPEGELHPYWGAFLMGFLFGKDWFEFTLYHSRFLAKKNDANYSRLCVADKLAIVLTPAWLYLIMTNWTKEIDEYMKMSIMKEDISPENFAFMKIRTESQKIWYKDVKEYCLKWVNEHKDGRIDMWTPKTRQSISNSGVWK